MEGGFYSTGWGNNCSLKPSQLPGPDPESWGWNNVSGVPFNTWDSTAITKNGSHALGFSICATAPTPGRNCVAYQNVYLGGANAQAIFVASGYHTDGNCPPILAWNRGKDQFDPLVAEAAGRYSFICSDNWGQRNTWTMRQLDVQADASGYITIMVGGAAHTGTALGAVVCIDDVSVK